MKPVSLFLFFLFISNSAQSQTSATGPTDEIIQKMESINKLDNLYLIRSALEERIFEMRISKLRLQGLKSGVVQLNYNSGCGDKYGCLMFYVRFESNGEKPQKTVRAYPISSNPCKVIQEAENLIGNTVEGTVGILDYPNRPKPWKVKGSLIKEVQINYEYASGAFSTFSGDSPASLSCVKLTDYVANRRAYEECRALGKKHSDCQEESKKK